jgi:hypothetical protein
MVIDPIIHLSFSSRHRQWGSFAWVIPHIQLMHFKVSFVDLLLCCSDKFIEALDVVGFGEFKKQWKRLLHSRGPYGKKPNKTTYLNLIAGPFVEAFSLGNVKAGFRKTGAWPLDATQITPQMMAPSLISSSHAAFPLTQPSPVKAAVQLLDAAFNYTPTPTPPLIESLTAPFESLSLAESSTVLPSLPAPVPSPVDEALQALKATRASYLFSNAPPPPGTFLPPPIIHDPPRRAQFKSSLNCRKGQFTKQELIDSQKELQEALRLAEERVRVTNENLRAANAQMVIQYLHVRSLDVERAATASATSRPRATVYPGGRGRELTDDACINEIVETERLRQEKEQQKQQRQETAALKKDRNLACEEEWKRVSTTYKEEVAAWKVLVDERGLSKKKNLPRDLLNLKPDKIKLKKDIIADFMARMGWDAGGAAPPPHQASTSTIIQQPEVVISPPVAHRHGRSAGDDDDYHPSEEE